MIQRFFENFTTVDGIITIGVHLIIIFMILPIHEFAHAFAADKLGDMTARNRGRLTINPLAHIDPFGALCLLVTGFGWAKPVPVNPLRFKKYRAGMSITAAAGPLSNLIVAFIATIVLRVVTSIPYSAETYLQAVQGEGALYFTVFFIRYFIVINIGLAIFNLIPVPPLDGSKILSYFTPASFDRKMEQYQMYIYFGFLIVMFSGILDRPMSAVRNAIYQLMLALTDWVEKLVLMIV
ncbi:MAG: site-2 protease family protein [Oscillospiraceae bacterium]|nr:site-2 protease family protein [Oscillospiraceae bacterium]